MRRRATLVTIAVAVLFIVTLAFLHIIAVPVRTFQYRYWEDADAAKGTEIPIDAAITRMIAHAKRDYFLAPCPGRRGTLNLIVARTVPPNDLYLFFSRSGSEEAVVYRAARENERLLWKAVWNAYD